MAIPLAVLIPLVVVAMVLAEVHDWTNGALGTVLLVLFALTAVVGTLMAPVQRR
jgi:hypothetical protein